MAKASRIGRWARIWAWLSLVVGIAAIVLVVIPGPLYHHRLMALGSAFDLLTKGAWVGVAAFGAGLLGLIAMLATRRFFTAVTALVALALGIIAFGGPYLLLRNARPAPPIHSIATDPMHPPEFVALAAARRKAPNGLTYGGGGARVAQAETDALQHFFASPAGRASPGRAAAVKTCTTWGRLALPRYSTLGIQTSSRCG